MVTITFESANSRSWSNPFLDLLEGNQLLFNEYMSRDEAEDFRRRRDENVQQALVHVDRLNRRLSRLLPELKRKGFGIDKKRTETAWSWLLQQLFRFAIT